MNARQRAQSMSTVAPPPPAPPPPPPLVDDNFDFMTLNLPDARWEILKAGEHKVLQYAAQLRSVFLWLPPATRWAKNQFIVEQARQMVFDALTTVSSKLVTSLVGIRKAWESIYAGAEQPSVNTNDAYWKWRFREGWQKNATQLKMAQNADHCHSILRQASNLLREYRNFMQGLQHKVEQTRSRDPQAGLRLSKARIKQEILRRRMVEIELEEKKRQEELRRQVAKKRVKLSNQKAKKRVRHLIMNQYHLKVKLLRKQVLDKRIKEHLDKEFEPGWRTSTELSQSYIHALEHSIKLEQHYLERKRRKSARFTCKKTLNRLRQRKKEEYGEKAHVFMRPLSRLVDVRGAELRHSPIRPRQIV